MTRGEGGWLFLPSAGLSPAILRQLAWRTSPPSPHHCGDVGVAFDRCDSLGAPDVHAFDAQYPCPSAPLSTLHLPPHSDRRMTRGESGWLLLLSAGLPPAVLRQLAWRTTARRRPDARGASGSVMTVDSKGRDLFIVDNSVSGWTGLRYLEEWSASPRHSTLRPDTSRSAPCSPSTVNGRGSTRSASSWARRPPIGLGRPFSQRSARKRSTGSMRASRRTRSRTPSCTGSLRSSTRSAPGRSNAVSTTRINSSAKAYITLAKLEVVGAQALVGSSNFTRPGLTKNIELNVQIQSAREVKQLQEWFETHWAEARDVTEAVIETVSRHTRLHSQVEHGIRRKWNSDSGGSGTANPGSGTRNPEEVEHRFRRKWNSGSGGRERSSVA